MPLPISLREFVDDMETLSDECEVYLNRKTGEFLGMTEEMIHDAERDEDDEDIPEWEVKLLPKIREAQNSEDWLPLPSKFDIDEYRIMRDFASTISDDSLRGDLLDTIGGRGTFGRWKSMLARHGRMEAWYEFRAAALQKIAIAWLDEHGIAYRE